MDFSVVIPSYNRAAILPRALDSVLGQDYPAAEILLIDDGSTDDTAKLINQKYPEVSYLYQKHAGVSSARNSGITQSRFEWIAFLDSDDKWLPGKLASQKALLEQTSSLICHTEEIWMRNHKRVNPMKKHRKHGGWIYPQCLPLCVISPSSVVIHRSVLDHVGLFDTTLPACEDYDLWLRICAHYQVAFVETPQIIKYGGHADQLSQKFWGMDRFRVQSLTRLLDSDLLSQQQKEQTQEMLLTKLRILEQGARKRNKLEAVAHYLKLESRYGKDTL